MAIKDFLSTTPTGSYQSDGFNLPSSPSADGNGLPYSKIANKKDYELKRNIISWFVPEFGIIKMYVNPNQIVYNHNKIISPVQTKGGFTVQYWGEKLTELQISGTTGSSGIEGINMLYEIYRAEQYAFDSVGLTLNASNMASDLASQAANALGGGTTAIVGTEMLGGLLGTSSPNNNALSVRNINSLAQLAFGIEMYYSGWVYRGFFTSMVITEKATDFLIDYNMHFIVLQRRGYRQNCFPWQRSPQNGPSQYDTETSFDLSNTSNTNNSLIKNTITGK